MLRLECANYKDIVYWVNPAHVVKVWRGKDSMTRLEQSTGAILCVRESPEEIADMIRRASK